MFSLVCSIGLVGPSISCPFVLEAFSLYARRFSSYHQLFHLFEMYARRLFTSTSIRLATRSPITRRAYATASEDIKSKLLLQSTLLGCAVPSGSDSLRRFQPLLLWWPLRRRYGSSSLLYPSSFFELGLLNGAFPDTSAVRVMNAVPR